MSSQNAGAEAAYLLEVTGVKKSFGPVVALKNAEFCLRRGSIHALCGGNGAGKSTFLRCCRHKMQGYDIILKWKD